MSGPSATLLDHFRHPRNAGRLAGATGSGTAENAGCGDIVRIDVRVAGGRVEAARFLAQGCPAAIGAASFVTEVATGLDLAAARALDANELLARVEETSPARQHGMRLALRALADALSA